MPLTDLVRYFNVADQAGDSSRYLEQGRVAKAAGIRIERSDIHSGQTWQRCRAVPYNASSSSGALS